MRRELPAILVLDVSTQAVNEQTEYVLAGLREVTSRTLVNILRLTVGSVIAIVAAAVALAGYALLPNGISGIELCKSVPHETPVRYCGAEERLDVILPAFLEHLTGPSRGTVSWLGSETAVARLTDDRRLNLRPESDDACDGDPIARVSPSGNAYAIEALGRRKLWVNGQRADRAELTHGDMIEFEETGPISRFRMCQDGRPFPRNLEDMLGDAVAYMRSSRRPIGYRLSTAGSDTLNRFLHETTLLFRVGVVFVLVGLAAFMFTQHRANQQLEARIEAAAESRESIAAALAQARVEALKPGDLLALRNELALQLRTNRERLAELERRSEASGAVIAASMRSVVLLQVGYGLKDVKTDAFLRHEIGPDGEPMFTPFGQPRLSVEGEGKPIEFQSTGTGFILEESRQIVTNRHVARPWTTGELEAAFEAQGLEPHVMRLIAYLPGLIDPVDARLLRQNPATDLALLDLVDVPSDVPGLPLATEAPAAGDEVIVMGYPTGLRSLLAQAGAEFLETLGDEADFWSVARRLSERGMVLPLASRGIVGQAGAEAVVYDAETTYGGSGGPVLDRDGRVVAVNAAIIPEFGGSNMGVPVAKLRQMLSAANGN